MSESAWKKAYREYSKNGFSYHEMPSDMEVFRAGFLAGIGAKWELFGVPMFVDENLPESQSPYFINTEHIQPSKWRQSISKEEEGE